MISRRQVDADQTEGELAAAPPDLDKITEALTRIPELADTLVGRPAEDLHALFEAFDVQVRYHPEDHVADVEITLVNAPGARFSPASTRRPTATGVAYPFSAPGRSRTCARAKNGEAGHLESGEWPR
jgi:hypothetical protein